MCIVLFLFRCQIKIIRQVEAQDRRKMAAKHVQQAHMLVLINFLLIFSFFFYRQVLLPISSFDSKTKFIGSLREQFSCGSFSLGGFVSQRDVVEFYKFLKNDYILGTARMCKLIQHLGHQWDEYWFISEKVCFKGKMMYKY